TSGRNPNSSRSTFESASRGAQARLARGRRVAALGPCRREKLRIAPARSRMRKDKLLRARRTCRAYRTTSITTSILFVVTAAFAHSAAGQDELAAPDVRRAAEMIDEDGLRAVVAEIASDRYE